MHELWLIKKYKFILFSLLISISTCYGATPEQIATECKNQMSLGICLTKREKSTIEKGATMILSGIGKVSMQAYYDYVTMYDVKNPQDNSMCNLALFYMKNSPGSDHDKIARALWTPLKYK